MNTYQIRSSNGICVAPVETGIFRKRKLMIEGEINSVSAMEFIKALMLLIFENSIESIDVLINSPGGEINAGLAMFDAIRTCGVKIRTICIGRGFSMGAVLFAAGTGGRYMLPNSELKTTENIAANGAFTVSFATKSTVVPCDYVGMVSARNVPDKFAKAGFHATKSSWVNAPLIDELPMALECKVKSFENGILIGEIVNVTADESIVTDGKIDIQKLAPIGFDPISHTYVEIGDVVGKAFSDGAALK